MNLDDIELPSNRKFGLFFTLIFGLVAVYLLFNQYMQSGLAFLLLALATVLAALLKSDLLAPFNKLWMRFGLLLGKIVAPIVMGVLFFLLFTPVALIGRLLGRDELRLKRPQVQSYWKPRSPVGPEPSSFKNQF